MVGLDIVCSVSLPNMFFYKIALAVLILLLFHLRIHFLILEEGQALLGFWLDILKCYFGIINTRFIGSWENRREVPCILHSLSTGETSCITPVQWQDKEMDIGTIHSLFWFYKLYVCFFVRLFLCVYNSVQLNTLICCSVVSDSLWNPMDCSMPGFPVLHHLLELAQTHIHWVSDAIQPSHPLIIPFSCLQSFPASGSFPMSWLFTSGGQNIGTSASAWVLPVNNQGWFPLGLTGLWSPPSRYRSVPSSQRSPILLTFLLPHLLIPDSTNLSSVILSFLETVP